MIVRDPDTRAYMGIECDVCRLAAPPAHVVLEHHGLVRMGWWCSGGKHLCPEHAYAADRA